MSEILLVVMAVIAGIFGFGWMQDKKKKRDQEVVDGKVDDLHDQQDRHDEEVDRREEEITDRLEEIEEEINKPPEDLTPDEAIAILRDRYGWPDPDGDHAP